MVNELSNLISLDINCDEKIDIYKGSLDQHDKTRVPIDASFQNHLDDISPKHAHEYAQIIYVESGRMIHLFENTIDILVKGDCVIIPPYTAHKMHIHKNEFANYYLVDFLFDAVCVDLNHQKLDYAYVKNFLIKSDLFPIKYSFTDDTQSDVEDLLKQIVKNVNLSDHDTSQVRQLLVRSLLMSLLAILSLKAISKKEQSFENQSEKGVLSALSYINEYYHQDICFDEILQLTHLSASHFRKLFKDYTGKTFSKYLLDLRINMAKNYLTDSSDSITDICYQVGFNDLSHFTRSFKNNTRQTPSEYRYSSINKNAEHLG